MYKSYITDIGTNSMSTLKNETIALSRICVSDKKVSESDIFTQTTLANEVCSLNIVSSETIDNVFNAAGRIESLNVDSGFYVKQVGLFLNINGEDVLFQIAQAADDFEGTYIPSKSEAEDFFAEFSLSVALINDNSIACNVDVTRYAKLSDLETKADINHRHNNVTQSNDGFMSAEDKVKLDNVEEGANNYEHPVYTPETNGFYKVTVDEMGHISGAEKVTKKDITDLGIPESDTAYNTVTPEADGLMSAEDKEKLDSFEEDISGLKAETAEIEDGITELKTQLKGNVQCITIAASDTKDSFKAFADYVCDGSDDTAIIQSAVDSLTNGGRVYLFEGTYNCTSTIVFFNTGVTLCGSGYATHINSSGGSCGILIYGNYTVIKDLRIDYTAVQPEAMVFYNTLIHFDSTGGGSSNYCRLENLIISTNGYAFSDNAKSSYDDVVEDTMQTGGQGSIFVNNVITTEMERAANFVGTRYRFRDNVVNKFFTDTL